jgi:hypothetical protein
MVDASVVVSIVEAIAVVRSVEVDWKASEDDAVSRVEEAAVVRSMDLGLHAPAETATGARAKHDNAMLRSGIILRHEKATEKTIGKRENQAFLSRAF